MNMQIKRSYGTYIKDKVNTLLLLNLCEMPVLRLREDQKFNSAWVERPEYLSSMWVISTEEKTLDGIFIWENQTRNNIISSSLCWTKIKYQELETVGMLAFDKETVGNETPKK